MKLSDLPPEILLPILRLTRDVERHETAGGLGARPVRNQTLLSISVVSHYFHHLSERIIFERLSWHIAPPIPSTLLEKKAQVIQLQSNSQQCAQLLTSKPHLARLVRQLTITATTLTGNIQSSQLASIRAIEQALPNLDNLRELTLAGLPITLPVYQAITSLPYLQTLVLKGCSFTPEDAPAMVQLPPPKKLTRLVIENLSANLGEDTKRIWCNLVFATSLKHLSMDSPVSGVVCQEMMSWGEPEGLESVAVVLKKDTSSEGDLLRFLERCPALMELTVSLRRKDTTMPVKVPQEILRQLRTYRGSFGCAEEFITGRPVEGIDINSIVSRRDNIRFNLSVPDVQHGLKSLTCGTVPVRYLRFGTVSWEVDLLKTVADLFPFLETLRIDGMNPQLNEDWSENDGLAALSALPLLRQAVVLVSRTETISFDRQLEIIKSWGSACPLLVEASIIKSRVWLRYESNDWKPIFTKSWREG